MPVNFGVLQLNAYTGMGSIPEKRKLFNKHSKMGVRSEHHITIVMIAFNAMYIKTIKCKLKLSLN